MGVKTRAYHPDPEVAGNGFAHQSVVTRRRVMRESKENSSNHPFSSGYRLLFIYEFILFGCSFCHPFPFLHFLLSSLLQGYDTILFGTSVTPTLSLIVFWRSSLGHVSKFSSLSIRHKRNKKTLLNMIVGNTMSRARSDRNLNSTDGSMRQSRRGRSNVFSLFSEHKEGTDDDSDEGVENEVKKDDAEKDKTLPVKIVPRRMLPI